MSKGLNTARLIPQLLNTALQQKDNPLYQIIRSLIEDIAILEKNALASGSSSSSSNTSINNNIAQIISDFGSATDSGNEPAMLGFPTSAGSSTTNNYTTNNIIQMMAEIGGDSEPVMLGYSGISTSSGSSTPDRLWSVLTNGDSIEPELVYAGRDVIMTHIP